MSSLSTLTLLQIPLETKETFTSVPVHFCTRKIPEMEHLQFSKRDFLLDAWMHALG